MHFQINYLQATQLSSTQKGRSYWCYVLSPICLSQRPGKCSCRYLLLSASKKDFWSFTFPSLALTYSRLILQAWLKLFWALRSRALRIWASPLCFWALLSRFKSCPHVFKPYSDVFEPYVYERHSTSSTLSEPRPHVFGTHLVGSLHFFNPDPAPPDCCLRNTHLVRVMSMRRVLKQASQRTYKNNVSGMKLGCKAIERR